MYFNFLELLKFSIQTYDNLINRIVEYYRKEKQIECMIGCKFSLTSHVNKSFID